MFATSPGVVNELQCLRRGDVAFFKGSEQLDWHLWPRADRVEVRFRGSKGDQYRKGAVLTRVRGAIATALHLGGGAVDLMVELMSSQLLLPPSAPLASYSTSGGGWDVWTQSQATTALRKVVAVAGMKPQEFALHSLRIGGATQLSASGVAENVLQREGRWRSDAYKVYERNVGQEVRLVSDALATAEGSSSRRQPGHGTVWGFV